MAKKRSRKKTGVRGKPAKSTRQKKTASNPAKKTTCSERRKGAGKKTGRTGRRPGVGRKIVEMRTWRRVGRLAADALEALEAGNVKKARGVIESIRAVAVCADEA